MNIIFQRLSESKISELLESAEKKVTLYAPGVSKQIALSLTNAASRGVVVQLLTDISHSALRLGFFDDEALRILSAELKKNTGLEIYNIPGIRQGVLIVDNRSWAFAVHSKFFENSQSLCRSFPNGLEFLQLPATEDTLPIETKAITSDVLAQAIGELQDIDLFSLDIESLAKREAELKQKEAELKEREENLDKREKKLEEELKNYENRCRLQKIEFKIQNYMIQNCSIHLKPELLIDIKDATRMKMTYALYEKGEPLPNVKADYTFPLENGEEEKATITLDGLQQEIDTVREKYISSLGVPYGNVILLDDIEAFEKALTRLETIGNALHHALQEVLRQKAIDVLQVLYRELHQKGAVKDNDENRFLLQMQDEINRVSDKAVNLKCIKNYTIFQAKDYESEDFQEAVCAMLYKRFNKGKKQKIKVFSDDVKIVYMPLRWWMQTNEQ